MEAYLWTAKETFGVGLMFFVFFMSIIIFLSLPPVEFRGFKEYIRYILSAAAYLIALEIFALLMMIFFAVASNYFFPK